MKKKILFVINTMGRAGAENCLMTMLKYMDKETYEISLFSVINRGEMFTKVPSGVRILNEHPCARSVLDREAKRDLTRMILKNGILGGYFFRDARYLWEMLSWQKKQGKLQFKNLFWKLCAQSAPPLEETYDLAVAYIQGAATYYVMDRVRAKKKIAFLHNEFLPSGYCPKLERSYYERADRIYCVSESIRAHFADIYPDMAKKTEVFYNLLDADAIRQKAREDTGVFPALSQSGNEIRLLTVARLAFLKGLDLAVPALDRLKKKGYPVTWYVVGDGPERQKLLRLIAQYGLEDSFLLLGAKENPYPYMASCDIYVQPSRYEGCCTAISEAVILGRPVIAADCDGNREQLGRYGTGILVSPDPDGIAEGIQRFCEDRGLLKQMAEQAGLENFEPYGPLQRIYQFA